MRVTMHADAAILNTITQSFLESMSAGPRFIVHSCGILLGFIDSTMEDIYDFITLCPNCITKTYHHGSDSGRKS